MIKVWNINTLNCEIMLVGHIEAVRCLIYLPDLNYMASGGYDCKVKVWNLSSGNLLYNLDNAHIRNVKCIGYV